MSLCIHFKAGVSKLVDAKQLVESLKIEAQEREKELAERQAKANEALEKITTTMKNAHSHKDELQSLKEKREDENKSIMQRLKFQKLFYQNCRTLLLIDIYY